MDSNSDDELEVASDEPMVPSEPSGSDGLSCQGRIAECDLLRTSMQHVFTFACVRACARVCACSYDECVCMLRVRY